MWKTMYASRHMNTITSAEEVRVTSLMPNRLSTTQAIVSTP